MSPSAVKQAVTDVLVESSKVPNAKPTLKDTLACYVLRRLRVLSSISDRYNIWPPEQPR